MAEHAALLLAAGGSRRLGQPKQLVCIEGMPLIRRLALAALATSPCELLVVLGAEVERCSAALADLPVRIVIAGDWAAGMGASLAAGARAAPPVGLLVLGVDQPALDAAHLQALVECWRADPEQPVGSSYAGVTGTPAMLPAAWREELMRAHGDQGARAQLRNCPGCRVVAAPELAFDIDHPGDLARVPGASALRPDPGIP